MDLLDLLLLPGRPFKTTCQVPRDLAPLTDVGEEAHPEDVGSSTEAVDRLWTKVEALYRTGLYPAVQICVRREGAVVLDRALGHVSGNGPYDPPDATRVQASVETPFCLYSASKAIAAMLIHKLDEQHLLHLDDRVCDYIPEFGVHGKQWITIRHVLCHRAGIPNLPAGAMDFDVLQRPDRLLELLCKAPTVWAPGRRLAYHAVSGGFVLGEVVRRVTGMDMRALQQKEVCNPLGFRWMNFGVAPEDVASVAQDAVTGLPLLPPITWLFKRALGTDFANAVRLASDPRFLTAVIPSANLVCTANELSAFYQCLLDEGELDGVRIFDPRTVRRATSEQTYMELDLTLCVPLRYGLGFMLGGAVSLFGLGTAHAFGHLGFTNIFSWADPERRLAVALLTSGKPFLSLDSARLVELILQVGRAFPKVNPLSS